MVVLDALVAGYVRRNALRSAVSVLAVTLGVATFLAIRVSVADAVQAFGARTGVFGDVADFSIERPGGTLPASLLARVRRASGIAEASPTIEGFARTGDTVLRIVGVDLLQPLPPSIEFRRRVPGPFARDGAAWVADSPRAGRGVIVSADMASSNAWHVGSTIVAEAGTSRMRLRVAAIRTGRTPALDANTALVDIATAEDLFAKKDVLDRIACVAFPGRLAASRHAVGALLPHGARIVTEGERRAEVERMFSAFTFELSILVAVASLAALLLVNDVAGVSVVERRAEIGTLRALGATRAASARAFAVEGARHGLVGGLLGAWLGGVAIAAAGISPPGTDPFGTDPEAPFVALALGFTLGLAGALPSARSSAALAVVHALDPRRSAGTPPRSAAYIGFTARVPVPLARGIADLRGAPRRVASSVVTLAVSVALASAVLTFAATLRASVMTYANASLHGDVSVRPLDGSSAAPAARFSPAAVARVRALPGVARADASRTLLVPEHGTFITVTTSSDGAGPRAGPSPVPATPGATIDEGFATRAALRIGDRFDLPASTVHVRARVVRIVREARFAGPVPVSTIALEPADFRRAYGDDTADALAIEARAGTDLSTLRLRLRQTLAPRALDIRTTHDLRAALIAQFDRVGTDASAIGLLALILGGFTVVTMLFALVLERRDDIRLMRQVGFSRAGVRAMVVCEGALIGAAGATCGIALGVATTLALVAADGALYGWSLQTVVPAGSLALVLVATVSIAAAAAIGPARYAARLR